MATVVVSVTTTKFDVPAATQLGGFRFILTPTSGTPLTQDVDGTTATFSNVSPGDYVPSCTRLDAAGQLLGPTASGTSFNIPAPTISVDVPQTVTVTVS